VTKLRIREICEKVNKIKSEQAMAEESGESSRVKNGGDISDVNFCKQNRWGSFDCILCKTIMKSLGQYEQHALTEFHKRNVEIFK
jgi:hypothetical protein